MAKKQFVCKECGAAISESGARLHGICRACSLKHVSERAAAKWAKMDEEHPMYCVWCGTQIHWNIQRKFQNVKTCSRKCQMYYLQSLWKESKEKLEERIITYIKEQGRYVTRAEICKNLHISDQKFTNRGLSCPELNFKAGTLDYVTNSTMSAEEVRARYKAELLRDPSLRILDVCKRLQISVEYFESLHISVAEIRHEIGLHNRNSKTAEEVTRLVVEWLVTQPCYRTAREICDALHIDYKCAIQNNHLTIPDLNALAGHSRPDISHYEEYTAFLLDIKSIKATRQKTFDGCVDKKKLRYDFWLDDYGVLLEINGDQHYSPKFPTYEVIVRHDKIKRDFASKNNIPLYVVDASPRHTFESRLLAILDQIVSKGTHQVTDADANSTELLENPTSKVEGNQQLRFKQMEFLLE